MSRLKSRLQAFARAGLLCALVALGVALVMSAYTNRRASEQLSSLLDRGQAERFFRPFPTIHERNRGPATASDLAVLLEQFRSEGLRYVVEYDHDGNVLVEAGSHAGSERPPRGEQGTPVLAGERVQVTFHPPKRPAGAPPRPPGPGAESRRPPELPTLVLEFEPTVSNQLRERATNSFIFSSAAALALLGLTFGLWLALAREERHRKRSERERQLAVLGEMSAVLAHEIRNPLASLKGTAQLLGEQLGDSPHQRKVTRIVEESKRLEDLSSTLLDLVRVSSVAPASVDPARLVRDAAQSVSAERITVNATGAPATWQLDPLRMEQVLKNVLQNAVQASPEGELVAVVLKVERGTLSISVRDRGEGLAPGSEERIFEAFHTTRTQGTGLGLAVARRIVELHGGRIRGENHSEGGALFTLELPAR